MLVLLAAIWGSSFVFIKVAVRRLHPEALVLGRLVFAVLALASVLYAGARLRHVAPMAVSFWTVALAGLISAPAGLARLPGGWPGWKAFGSVVALGVLGLGVAYLLYFALIAQAGASRAILVTYL